MANAANPSRMTVTNFIPVPVNLQYVTKANASFLMNAQGINNAIPTPIAVPKRHARSRISACPMAKARVRLSMKHACMKRYQVCSKQTSNANGKMNPSLEKPPITKVAITQTMPMYS